MGKSHQQTAQSNTYTYLQQPTNPYFDKAKELIEGYDGGASNVREAHARNINAIEESGNSVYGADTTPQEADRIKASRLFRNNMDLGRGLSDSTQNAIGYKNAAYMSLGGATAPQLVQSGGNSDTTQSGGLGRLFLGSFAQGAGSGLAA